MEDVTGDGGETFGQWVKRHRETRNLSRERLELLAGYAEGSGMVAQIEAGTRGKRSLPTGPQLWPRRSAWT